MNHSITGAVRARTTSPLNYEHIARPPARFPRDIRLRDGSELRLRELRPGDRERLKAFFARCSPEAIRYRFMSSIHSLSDGLLNYLVDIDGIRHKALVLTRGEGDGETILAEGRYAALKERPSVVDVAFLVADDMRRRGIATLLLHELTELARRNGATHFSADVLADNWGMLSLLRKKGPSPSGKISSGVIHFEIPITHDEARPMPDVA